MHISQARDIKILGVIEAGFSTPTEENNLDQISIDDWIVEDRNSTFMLKVKSNSMKKAGILKDDYVIVERKSAAKIGNIVITELDGKWAMHYLRKNNNGYYLESGDESKIVPETEQEIIVNAVVKAVIRKY